ncbi:hypothetical protein, partial [Corallococcus sp. CA053C]|uniref:hypothetical protein n=1 Tax=Corallococcus sp. CA053C TaxID=2316732 RepID=UPI00272ABD99
GLARWVGAYRQPLAEGEQAALPDGTRVTVVRCVPPRQLRLRLERDEWPSARTVQLRVLPSVHGVTVALHAEGLRDEADRDQVLAQWTHALEGWEAFSGREVTVSPVESLSEASVEQKGSSATEPPDLEPGLAQKVRSDTKKAASAKKAMPAKKAAPAKKAMPAAKKGSAAKKAASAKKGTVMKRALVKKGPAAKKTASGARTAAKKSSSPKKAPPRLRK